MSPQWGAADAEIKVPSGENTALKRSYSKLMGVLWWLAGRESMKQIVKRFDWSIGTFHGAVHLFSTAIVEHLMPQTIRWPSLEDEVKRCLLSFEQNYNFQGKRHHVQWSLLMTVVVKR